MDYFGIGALSIQMGANKVQQAVETSLLKKTMDTQESQAVELIKSLLPSSGSVIDTYA